MPRRDNVHEIVRAALIREGWTITHDPLPIRLGRKPAHIDLGAEKIIAAEKENEVIAVEIKSFLGTSTITEFYRARGQFDMYSRAMRKQYPGRILFLAMPIDIYRELDTDIFDFEDFEDLDDKILIFDPNEKLPLQWIK